MQKINSINRDGLVGYWNFNEGRGIVVNDNSGNGRRGSLVGPPVFVDGKSGKALRFNGSAQHVIVTDYKGILGTGASTVKFRFKTTDTRTAANLNTVITWGGSTTGQASVRVINIENGQIWGRFNAGNTINTTQQFNDGQWHDCIFEMPASTTTSGIRIFVDGVEVATTAAGSGTINTPSGPDLSIGYFMAGGFNGDLQDIALYNRTLKSGEVQEYSNSGLNIINASTVGFISEGLLAHWTFDAGDVTPTQALDRSGNGNIGTFVGGQPKRVPGKVGQALLLDGQYINMGNNISSINLQQDHTITAWIKPSNIDTTQTIISRQSNPFNEEFELTFLANTGILNWVGENSSGAPLTFSVTSHTIVPGIWQLITICIDKTNNIISGFYNTEHVTFDATNISQAVRRGTPNMAIGTYRAGSRLFQGAIDDVRIYNRILTIDDVNMLFNSTITLGNP